MDDAPQLSEEEVKAHAVALARTAVRYEEMAAQAQKDAAAMRAIVSGYVEIYPELRSEVERIFGGEVAALALTDEKGRPKGAEAVRLILQEAPGERVSVSTLVNLLRERGWLPESENPANAVRAALERLVADKTADVRKHRWRNSGGGWNVTFSYDPDVEEEDYDDFGEEPF